MIHIVNEWIINQSQLKKGLVNSKRDWSKLPRMQKTGKELENIQEESRDLYDEIINITTTRNSRKRE